MQTTADYVLVILTVALVLLALLSALSSAYLAGVAGETERWRREVEDLGTGFEQSRHLLLNLLTSQVTTISEQTLSLADHVRRETALLVELHRLECRYEKYRRKQLFRAELSRRSRIVADDRTKSQQAVFYLCETKLTRKKMFASFHRACRRNEIAQIRTYGPIPLPEPRQETA